MLHFARNAMNSFSFKGGHAVSIFGGHYCCVDDGNVGVVQICKLCLWVMDVKEGQQKKCNFRIFRLKGDDAESECK